MSMHEPVAVLLQSIVDYAGLFPPARLDLPEAMASYARALAGPHSAWLGRFVVPASRVDEVVRHASALPIPAGLSSPARPAWPLSVLVSGEDEELTHVLSLRSRRLDGIVIQGLEFGPLPSDRIDAIARRAPSGLDCFFECSPGSPLGAALTAIGRHGAMAKIRTGGTTPDAFPSAADLSRFMIACAGANVPFKATAGLHHALPGRYALTYAPESLTGGMHGFLNVCIASALVRLGASLEDAVAALRETSAEAFAFTGIHLRWRHHTIDVAALADMRRHLFRSFGSCSFDEPIRELAQLRLI
jgi:hypothetical protein